MDAEHGSDKEKFWKRVGGWFKTIRPEPYDDSMVSESNVSTFTEIEMDADDAVIHSSSDLSAPSIKSRLSKSSAGLERIEQEYNRVVGLVESMQEHLGQNAERTEMMAKSIERLADNLEALPETSRRQLEVLESIREEAAADTQRAVNIEQSLSQLPQLADAQREVMVTISRRMEESKDTDEKLSETLSGVRQSVELMSRATETSANAITMMRSEESERQDKIAKLLQQQTDRITWMASSAIALAVIAVILGLISLFKT